MFLTGSSITIRLAGLPVMPDIRPRESSRPALVSSSNSVDRLIRPIPILNKFAPNNWIFSLFRRQNLSANSSLYDAMITLSSGCLPMYQDGNDSVIVIDLPCCGGVSITRMSYALPVLVSTNLCTSLARYLAIFVSFQLAP